MEYTVTKLANLAGVSSRTLRYYDQVGLLSPNRVNSSGYRIYGAAEVDKLQQILFYRELGVSLVDIRNIISSKDFDGELALKNHLAKLLEKREQLDLLIENVQKTISVLKGEIKMSDKEKFEGFKQKLVDENERQYGKEIREKYGQEAVDNSNARLMGMSEERYAQVEELSARLDATLKQAFEQGDPSSELAQQACGMHKEWLCFFWDNYSKEAHKGLAQMYVDDERFSEHYDKIALGLAVFLRDAINIYCG
ncbi:MAG: MerR family transcriptional regulator [Eubacteriaceae bacterium]|nr:MerR family transcriptional regulator [Eubacteriaceae bacterium]